MERIEWEDIYLVCLLEARKQSSPNGMIPIRPQILERQLRETQWLDGFDKFLENPCTKTSVYQLFHYDFPESLQFSSYLEFSLKWDGEDTVYRVLTKYIRTPDNRIISEEKYCRPWMRKKKLMTTSLSSNL